jgi:hypothetical protein
MFVVGTSETVCTGKGVGSLIAGDAPYGVCLVTTALCGTWDGMSDSRVMTRGG